LRRCAWHRRYRGYGLVYGIAGWRGLRIGIVEGICRGCAGRLRSDLRAPATPWRADPPAPTDPLPVPPLALASIALAAVLFVANPLDQPSRVHERPEPAPADRVVAERPSRPVSPVAPPRAAPAARPAPITGLVEVPLAAFEPPPAALDPRPVAVAGSTRRALALVTEQRASGLAPPPVQAP